MNKEEYDYFVKTLNIEARLAECDMILTAHELVSFGKSARFDGDEYFLDKVSFSSRDGSVFFYLVVRLYDSKNRDLLLTVGARNIPLRFFKTEVR